MLSHLSIKFFKEATQATSYKETPNDIACKCPICGDSPRKKRLHLYTKDGNLEFVHCFNGGCELSKSQKTIDNFLKEYYPEIYKNFRVQKFNEKLDKNVDLQKIADSLETSQTQQNFANDSQVLANNSLISDNLPNNGNILQSIADPQEQYIRTPKPLNTFNTLNNDLNTFNTLNNDLNSLNTLNTLNAFKNPLNSINLNQNLKFIDIQRFLEPLKDYQIQYLKNRKLENLKDISYNCIANINIDGTIYYIKDFLVIPMYYENKIYGFYSRNIKNPRDFKTYISTQGYKLFNYFNIDNSENVYIFESIFDMYSSGLKNSVACLGARPPLELFKKIKNPVLCLDNDLTGINNSIDLLQKHNNCKSFVPPKDFKYKDINEMLVSENIEKVSKFIQDNIYNGISAITRLKLLR